MPKVTLTCHPFAELRAGSEAKPKDLATKKEILRFAQNDSFAVTLAHFSFLCAFVADYLYCFTYYVTQTMQCQLKNGKFIKFFFIRASTCGRKACAYRAQIISMIGIGA